MGYDPSNQAVQYQIQKIMPIIEPEKHSWIRQLFDLVTSHIPGGENTMYISAFLGLPIVLLFIFRTRVMLFIVPIAEFILTFKRKKKDG